jgi:hypothetical protein
VKTPYTRPHDLVFQDSTQTHFVLTPGNKLHDQTYQQHFNDEESDEAKSFGEIMQLAFNGMTVSDIEREYSSRVELLQPYSAKGVKNVFG